MKIAIVTSHFTACLADHTRVTNGLDSIVVKSIPVLLKHGHEISVICVGKVDEYWNDHVIPHSVLETTAEEVSGKSARMRLSRAYYRAAEDRLNLIQPDLVWSHIPSPGSSADWALEWPTIHHVHQINPNSMYALGRVKGLAEVIENGGTVYNSEYADRAQMAMAKDYLTRTNDTKNMHMLEKKITSVYQIVNVPLDSKFLDAEFHDFRKEVPFMMGRYDLKFVDKNIHKIDKLGIPMYAVVSGNHPKYFEQFRTSPTMETYINIDRDLTIELMKQSKVHISACMYESCPVFNYELLCQGSLPIGIGYSEDEPNAATVLARRVLGEELSILVPDSIPITDPNLKERLEEEIAFAMSYGPATREIVAQTARKALSHDAWYAEFLSCIPGKMKQINELDL
jgi:hypothetical protein